MLKAKAIIEEMNNWALEELIDTWDNTGFQIGDKNREVSRVLVALDVDEKVVEKAIREDYQMIISHHPIIFSPLKEINTNTPKGKLIYDMIRHDIVGFNAHSNLDQAEDGVNVVLGDIFDLQAREFLLENEEYKNYGYGVVGNIDETSVLDYIKLIKERLNVDKLTVFGDLESQISRVAICGGSGSSFIMDAHKKKADLYITGDIKYHDGQLASDLGLIVVDAGHYHTEKVILPKIKSYLEDKFEGKLKVDVWDNPSPNYKIL